MRRSSDSHLETGVEVKSLDLICSEMFQSSELRYHDVGSQDPPEPKILKKSTEIFTFGLQSEVYFNVDWPLIGLIKKSHQVLLV